jgi:Tfp pilus assembly protein PilO
MQDPIKQNLKIVNYTGIAAVTLFLAGTLAFGMYPMYKRGREDIRATAEKQEARQRVGALRQDITDARTRVQAAESRLQEAEKRLPAKAPDSDNEFSRELNEVAKAAGIRVESMPPMSKPKSDGVYKFVNVTVDGTGDWESCLRFLRGIDNMNRVVRLDSVLLDTQKDAHSQFGASSACRILVRFSTYYLER